MQKTCAICGKGITERFHVCMRCLNTYHISLKYREYPQWLKELVRINARELFLARKEEGYISTDIVDDSEDALAIIRRF